MAIKAGLFNAFKHPHPSFLHSKLHKTLPELQIIISLDIFPNILIEAPSSNYQSSNFTESSSKMIANSPQSTYFSFPSYESHFVGEIKAEEPTPVTPTPFHTALQPLVDIVTEAHSIIQHCSSREAESELNVLLARANLAFASNTSVSLPHFSECSSCASSIMSSRPPSLIESIKSWWTFS
ncbi:hypothetical protein Pst134EA_018987 [Puccinia striiformis f. sp. tritici]|nr:hypothetical protein Pst134EA_018987 [Puccinia striiformis f. sp. tritici]KAH9449056.1 hypothetical protein Pst134EB_019892 [Puccinia striiformis f. sp. tritici]KAH9458833.1 hypothetical protein Pst134EA_018987 [Puccinia striiformis f. sp. tritici]